MSFVPPCPPDRQNHLFTDTSYNHPLSRTGIVFKESDTFQPCVEGVVEVVDHIPRLCVACAYKNGKKTEEQSFCDLGEPCCIVSSLSLSLSLSTSAQLLVHPHLCTNDCPQLN